MPTVDSSDSNRKSIDSSSRTPVSRRTMLALLGISGVGALSGLSSAHPDDSVTDDPDDESHEGELHGHGAPDPSKPLMDHDASTEGVVSDGPSAHVVKNFALVGRGERLVPDATTDVWIHGKYAYVGTFNTPCGTGEGFSEGSLVDDLEGPGIAVFDVHNNNRPEYVGTVPSVEGSRTNDVKVAEMNSGAILVHSNESCAGGLGGFEIYDVDDPTAPEHLAHVQTDDINELLREDLGFVDFGVHNLWLFTQGERDYVAAVVESEFGNFQIFDITDPTNPEFLSGWGAESLFDPAVDWSETDDFSLILAADAYLFDGFGSSQNRFLHDVTIDEAGDRAYLSNWDAGLVLLDISDPADPQLISVALDPNAGDGEVNSHAAWPSEDGTVVVETNEDFDPFVLEFSIDGEEFPAEEGAFTSPIVDLPDRTMSGPTRYIGLACPGDSVPSPVDSDEIAVIQRGTCAFSEKAQAALDAGYVGIVVFNDEARGDEVITMGGDPVDIPGVFVGHSTGLEIFGVTDVDALTIGDDGAPIEVEVAYDRWGNVRIWDYTDEANPILASEFDTVCSANPGDESCDPAGTYSVHNVVVEDDLAYISWYSNGMLTVDISDPYNPVETGRYNPGDEDFREQNGGIQDLWGVYKERNSPWIYGSDRNGGLYVLKLLGSGSDKRNR